ncbi:MAG: hypothetical protein ACREBC_17850, partial [Pyrinomonadaceae bacterium]
WVETRLGGGIRREPGRDGRARGDRRPDRHSRFADPSLVQPVLPYVVERIEEGIGGRSAGASKAAASATRPHPDAVGQIAPPVGGEK